MEADRAGRGYPLGRLVEYHSISPFQKHPELFVLHRIPLVRLEFAHAQSHHPLSPAGRYPTAPESTREKHILTISYSVGVGRCALYTEGDRYGLVFTRSVVHDL